VTLRGIADLLAFLFPVSEAALALATRARRTEVRRAPDDSLRTLWVVITASVCAAVFVAERLRFAALPISALARDLAAIGLMILGLAIRWTAIRTLGRFFSVHVAIQQEHAVIDAGPYRYARHPSYTGLLIAFLGLGFYFGNALAILVLMVPVLVVFLRRIETEERALRAALGPAYEAYCAKTARLWPGIY